MHQQLTSTRYAQHRAISSAHRELSMFSNAAPSAAFLTALNADHLHSVSNETRKRVAARWGAQNRADGIANLSTVT
jgi:hypothetical protein